MKKPSGARSFVPKRSLVPPATAAPVLVVVIDTEEEFDWGAPFSASAVATENVQYQELGQAIFDRYGVVPTYAIDYPVASSRSALSLLGSFLEGGRCEIGAHLHPWVNPPAGEPIDSLHSYPGNLPPDSELAKLDALTKCIADGFGRRPVIYKAGRYGVGAATEQILVRLGYKIDVSVVPHSDFSADGGPDFTDMPARPFLTAGGIVVLPLSVQFVGRLARFGRWTYPWFATRRGRNLHLPGFAARLGLLERLRLSPEGHGASDMLRQTRAALRNGENVFMLTYHSSSLLPGGSPYVRSEADRVQFLEKIETYLQFFVGECAGRVASVSEVAALLAQTGDSEESTSGR